MTRMSIGAVVGGSLVALGAFVGCGGSGGGAVSATDGRLVRLLTDALAPGTTGVAYAQTFTANFPHGPGLFLHTGGQLPPGLKLDAFTGELSGYCRQTGTFHFDIGAQDGVDPAVPIGRDANFARDVKSFTVVVDRGAPSILPQVVPTAQYRAGFSYQIDAAGGTPPYTFAKVGGTLPNGLSVSPTGLLGSFPTQALQHPYAFDVTLTDSTGATDTQTLEVDVVVLPLVIFTSTIPPAAKDFPYAATIELASLGAGVPHVWSQLPPGPGEVPLASIGMQVTPAGVVTNLLPAVGPTAVSPPGGFLFTLQVSDESSQTVSRQYALVVNEGPTLTTVSPISALAGPWTASGMNFQPGAQLIFKPGAGQSVITPTFVNSTTLTFLTAPPTPTGGGFVTVRVRNPDGGFFDLPNGFVFPLTNLAFGTKGFVASPPSGMGVACADLTGDGRAEIVHCGASGFRPNNFYGTQSAGAGLELLRNNGGLSFTTTVLDSGNFYDVEIADVNTDGKPDIVALGETSIKTWINNPLGTFTVVTSPFSSALFPQDLSVGRMNSDSLPDLVFGTSTNGVTAGSLYSMVGNGAGGFTAQSSTTSGLTGTYGVVANALLDFDGDGRADVVSGNGFNGGTRFFYRSSTQADGSFGAWTAGTSTSLSFCETTAVVAGNFFGDGRPAVVVNRSQDPSDGGGRQLAVFSGANLATVQLLAAPAALGKWLGAADFDFDGKTDWVLSTTIANLLVYKGSTLALALTLDASSGSPAISSPRTGRIAAGDLDGDGKFDIVATTSYWAYDYQPNIYSGSYQMNTSGDGGQRGLVYYLNTSN